jgi:hypothetical protein
MLVADAILLSIAIALGIVLAFSSRQYGPIVFAVHKITALGAMVITSILCYRYIKAAPVSAIFLVVVAVACISFVLLFASGAVMSTGHGSYRILKAVHVISTVLLTICETGIIVNFTGKFQ